jgi:hypothetical protein
MPRSDLNPAEQEHVRALLRMLRAKLGSWRGVQHALPLVQLALGGHVGPDRGERDDRVRVARLLDATISQVLTGQALPPGTCRHCGRPNERGVVSRRTGRADGDTIPDDPMTSEVLEHAGTS